MPLVSVVLPVYKAENFIENAVKSILDQTLAGLELIVVTNGSNARTLEKVNSLSDERVRIFHLRHPDIVAALNKGLAEAKGKYIARMDADDYATPERLEKQVAFLEDNGEYDVVSCKVRYQGDQEKHLGYYLYVEWINQLSDHNDIYENRFVDSPVAHPSLLVRKSLFEKYGHYKKGDFPEDYELVLRWLDIGVKIGKTDEMLLHWRDHAERLSRNNNAYSTDAFYELKTKYFAKWFKKNCPGATHVLVWGAGKSVRLKSRFLGKHDIQIAGYIDVKETHAGNDGPTVYHFSSFPADIFVLSYVGDRKGRKEIFDYLVKKGLKQGKNFYMMA